jgi:hypothetical protein
MMIMMIRFHPEKLAFILAVVGSLCIAQVAVLYKVQILTLLLVQKYKY